MRYTDETNNRLKSNQGSLTPRSSNKWSIWGKAIIGAQLLLFIAICGVLISGNYNKNYNKSSNVVTDPDALKANEMASEPLQSSKKTSPPHIIFVLADDVGWNSIGYENFDLSFATPFLTGLANEGVVISNYYSQEVCTPARAALLTGRYPLTIGMQYGVVEAQLTNSLPLDETTIAEVLRDEGGYTSYILGKWHLGHHSPLHLPTARGFDSFLGFLLGENYYWSKKFPTRSRFTDFMDSDTDCYQEYEGDDKHTYSTFFYRDKAKEIIKKHDESDPMFLFLSFQAVHSPFFDKDKFENGIPTDYVSSEIEKQITKNVNGRKRREYAMALAILDDAVESIYDEAVDKGIMDNSYFIFASDNGGCYAAGGKNGPLRGTKGSLFEGGVRVDAFVYSKLLSDSSDSTDSGRIYTGLMHVSDWFPTILAMASIDYEPPEGKEIDGFNQLTAFVTNSSPREYILYNYFIDVNLDGDEFDMWENGTFAIRNSQYKLMHTFNSPTYSDWYDYDEIIENDDSLDGAECSQQSSIQGSFTYYLYDLVNDPYETTNVYYAPESFYTTVKDDLYSQLEAYRKNSKYQVYDATKSVHALTVWKEHSNLVSPWTNDDDVKDLKKSYGKSYPYYCGEVIDDDKVPHRFNDDGEVKTTVEPTHKPSHKPSYSPDFISEKPTKKPTDIPSYSPDYTSEEPSYSPDFITEKPTKKPTHMPSYSPDFITEEPSYSPDFITEKPTKKPTDIPSYSPDYVSEEPSYSPDFISEKPTKKPTHIPSYSPDYISEKPTKKPTHTPSYSPTLEPTPLYDDDDYPDDAIEDDVIEVNDEVTAPTIKPTPLYDDDDYPDDALDDDFR